MMNIGPAAKETALQLLMLIILKVIAPCLPKSELCGGRVCWFPESSWGVVLGWGWRGLCILLSVSAVRRVGDTGLDDLFFVSNLNLTVCCLFLWHVPRSQNRLCANRPNIRDMTWIRPAAHRSVLSDNESLPGQKPWPCGDLHTSL